MYHAKTIDASTGKWRGILMTLGLPESALNGRHGPCPLCGGRDRWRWDNKDGSGSYICGQCGAGTGMQLAQRFLGLDFAEAAKRVDEVIGNVKYEPPRPQVSAGQQLKAMRELWKASTKMQDGDPVDAYLRSRDWDLGAVDGLRYAPACRYDGERVLPAMVALVSDADGNAATLHRTYLGPNGKADVEVPRKLMPGSVPDGAAIRLCAPRETLGIAEGIETALSAWKLFGTPCWAAINSTMLQKWAPPEECREVVVYGDADKKFGGQAAAFALAHRLALTGRDVAVHLPRVSGWDWNDVLRAERKAV